MPGVHQPMAAREIISNRLVHVIAAGVALSVALALVWKLTPLAEVVTPSRALEWVEAFASTWWAPIAIFLAFTPACFVMFPRQIIIVAAAVAFGPVQGWLLSIAGVLFAAAVGWRIGRQLNAERVRRWAGPSFEPSARLLRRRGLVAVMAVRALPVAPFAVESVVGGALRIKLSDLLLGTLFGMAPGMLGTSIIGDQIGAAIGEGRHFNPWIMAGALTFTIAIAIFAQWWFGRLQREESGA